MAHGDELTALDEARDRLAEKYRTVPANRITDAVTEAHRRSEGSPVRAFIPLLVERRVSEALGRGSIPGMPA
ncbi:three-helix bundle dimerization domain-containing protein [Mycolicibacterium palauense]|uniref:three-helix bundle dimerization domain-containing protein n=1 Tax=Mycolicibacterium palauense TaxID=2034511 RepID=UPI001145E9F8|nr:hypothetical protein [Mycolicibacterium palauense]